MFQRDQFFLRAAVTSAKAALACLALLLVLAPRAQADTLTVVGSSGSPSPPNVFTFVSQSFNHNFTVASAGQTFDFVFGQYSVPPRNSQIGQAGCTDGPCMTLTGALTNPAGQLSFGGVYFRSTFGELSVDWRSDSGPFAFTTAEGGTGQFTIQLVDFSAVNSTSTAQSYNQLARLTVTQFTPGASTPTPEPATLLLLGTGLAAAGAARRRQSRRQGRGPHPLRHLYVGKHCPKSFSVWKFDLHGLIAFAYSCVPVVRQLSRNRPYTATPSHKAPAAKPNKNELK